MVEESKLEFITPWRCQSCNVFMYNLTEDGYPAPGAPVGYSVEIDSKQTRICSLCKDMFLAAANSKFLIKEHVKEQAEKKAANRLRPGAKYLE